ETDIEPIYAAWLQLSDSERPKTDQDFRLIDSVADEQGINAILEEGRFHGKVLWTFLEHPEYLETAAMFREADELPRNYWRDRDGLVDLSPRDDKAACEEMANLIKLYFRKNQGRGYACT